MRKELKMVEDIMKKSERAQRKEKALKKEVTEGTLKFLERGISEMTKNLNSMHLEIFSYLILLILLLKFRQ